MIKITGFGSGESVTIATTMWTKTSFSCVTGSTVGTLGSCTESAATAVADVTGGRKAITATGATSGFHATTEYKVNPWVAFYDSPTGGISYSFIGTAPTSIVVEAHGLTAGKLASNSITVAGVSTNHAAVTIGTNGEFHTAGAKLVVSPTSNVPFGLASVVIKGETFSYASGNIALAPGTWGGALISSIIGSATTTGVAAVSATSFMPGSITVSLTSPAPPLSQIGFFGYGFVPNAGGGGTLSIATPTGAQYSTAVAFNAGNGGVGGAERRCETRCQRRVLRDRCIGRHTLVFCIHANNSDELRSHSDSSSNGSSKRPEPVVRRRTLDPEPRPGHSRLHDEHRGSDGPRLQQH